MYYNILLCMLCIYIYIYIYIYSHKVGLWRQRPPGVPSVADPPGKPRSGSIHEGSNNNIGDGDHDNVYIRYIHT